MLHPNLSILHPAQATMAEAHGGTRSTGRHGVGSIVNITAARSTTASTTKAATMDITVARSTTVAMSNLDRPTGSPNSGRTTLGGSQVVRMVSTSTLAEAGRNEQCSHIEDVTKDDSTSIRRLLWHIIYDTFGTLDDVGAGNR
jgi:hypothetical protein